jgi:hypothetical protein
MPADYSRILPWIFALIIPFIVYRRLRRNFGAQRLSPTRMIVRMAILLTLAAVLAPRALSGLDYFLADLGGALIGVALAYWGASRTRFLNREGRLHYVPHTYTGIAVSLLLLGRLAYRLVQLNSTAQMVPAVGNDGAGPRSIVSTPLTSGMFFVLIGYYACYYGLVLRKSKHLTAADLEAHAAGSRGDRYERDHQETRPHQQNSVSPPGNRT